MARPAMPSPCGTQTDPPASYEHVIWIWMENHPYNQVIGSADAPYTTALANQCGTATNYSRVGRPSLPNYLGAIAGTTFGIADDAPPGAHEITADNLFRQVRASDRAARSYEESMPANCTLGSTGRYAVKHNPAAYFTGANDRAACERDDVPMGVSRDGAFATDLANDALPSFSFITPDLCHDTHDCAVAEGDRWLADWLPKILTSATYRRGRTAVFIVYDEPTPMPNVVVAPSIPPGTVVSEPVDHYSLLRTTEELLDISSFLGAAATAPSMRARFHM